MLVLKLYDGEFVQIGENVRVYIDRCIDDGKATKLAIDAPKEITVLREELLKSHKE